MRKTRFMAVREASTVVLAHLDGLPPSEEAERLRTRVQECLREAEAATTLPPNDRERNGLMATLLALYVDVMKLERMASARVIGWGAMP
jgi:hypothetical protein